MKGLGFEIYLYILFLVDNNLSMRGWEKSMKWIMIFINVLSFGYGVVLSINIELCGGYFKGLYGVSWGYLIRK